MGAPLLTMTMQGAGASFIGPHNLMSVREVCAFFGVTSGWVYKRTKKKSADPLPIVRLASKCIRFNPYQISTYMRAHERHRLAATLETPNGNAPAKEKGHFTLKRKRLQTGSVRLREDANPPWWEGFYRENVVSEDGTKERKRVSVNLGTVNDVKTEKAARQKLAVVLEPINNDKCRPKMMMSFSGFIVKYRSLRLANFKQTTVHGYETNIRAHYLPEFGGNQVSEISPEMVQDFLNRKRLEGKSVQTLKNLKWGLSSIFECAIKFGYIATNPCPASELPANEVKERKEMPTGDQLVLLIDALPEPFSTLVYLFAVSSIRPEEIAFKWLDLVPATLDLWIVRAVNKGQLHTPKYHRRNRPIRLTEADVERLLSLKRWMKAEDGDWMFPNRIKNGKRMKPGPIWHETVLARRIQPVADKLGLPHITWRLLRHWGATSMIRSKMDLPAVQQRLGHSRPNIVLEYYAEVLPESANEAAAAMSGQIRGSLSRGRAENSVVQYRSAP